MRLLAAAIALLPAAAAAQLPTFTTPAPYAYMKDMSNGAVLFAKGENTPIPPASMGKMMSVYVAFDMLRKGDAKLTQKIRVRPETWKKWHSQGSTMFLSPNEEVTVADLLQGIITLSGNDACVVLAEGLAGTEEQYVALMNATAKRIGLTGSRFANTNGWPDPNERVTPRDLAIIAERTIAEFPGLYRRFYPVQQFSWGKTLGEGASITQPNRNPLLGRVAGADGLKTGHTEEAGYGFTGSAVQDGRRLVMVIAGLKSFNERIAQSVAFMEWGFRAWTQQTIAPAGKIVERAPVWMGSAKDVGIAGAVDLKVTVPRGFAGERVVKIVYDGPIKAPIKRGQPVATMVVTVPGMPATRTTLVATEDVAEAGFFGRIGPAFRALVLGK
ncbi:D-alanyl-D-alanine carboxypeptidase family protein [Glacieibacterium frigidum]|uniref:serine-type D-Ala-D-Ala carboxypeptidase n=1 Tax=Glacieibacterium frigidum TaxID=2593303 RepID=A0A552UIH4_9SPHN|nr:D-alanyl-D-alanine carboxypeptidase family protein [Glacieibacterium frigidum]TRW17991.1 D-alanyl-D-alanine carboxypeptidase [Glacieibacterium frigidum]